MPENIYNSDFAKYLPQPLTHDPKIIALAKSVSVHLLQVSSSIEAVLIYSRIDELPEGLLDILAYDLHCDWYDYQYPLETKRKILKNSIKIHRKLGTKYAVEKALTDVYSTAKVTEWFEYEGRPFCFKVTVNVSQTGIDEKTTQEIEAKMKFYKNVRSHCDGIFYSMNAPPASVTVGAQFLFGGNLKVKPLLKEHVAARGEEKLLSELRLGAILSVKRKSDNLNEAKEA